MHEFPITQSILDIALKHAEQAGAKSITQINLAMGELSTMVDNSIQFYWDVIAKGTIAEKAKLHFRRIPSEFQCMVCFNKYHPNSGELSCPQCGSVGAKILAGEEFYVESIDIDK